MPIDGTLFGQLLRAHRERAELAQNQLARLARMNVGTINRLEHGHRLPTGREQVLCLTTALQLSTYETDQLLHAAGLPCLACPMARYQER